MKVKEYIGRGEVGVMYVVSFCGKIGFVLERIDK